MFEELYMGITLGAMFGVMAIWTHAKMVRKFWPITVPIVSMKGGSRQWFFDRAKKVKDKHDKTIIKIKLMKSKDAEFSLPKYKDNHLDEKGKDVMPISRLQDDNLYPMDVLTECPECHEEMGPDLTIEDKDVGFWAAVESDRVNTNYSTEGWLHKWGPLVGFIMLGLMFAFTVIYMGNTIRDGYAAAGAAANTNYEAAKIMSDVARALRGLPPVNETVPLGG